MLSFRIFKCDLSVFGGSSFDYLPLAEALAAALVCDPKCVRA